MLRIISTALKCPCIIVKKKHKDEWLHILAGQYYYRAKIRTPYTRVLLQQGEDDMHVWGNKSTL